MNNSVLNNLSRHIFEKRKGGSVEEKGRKIGPEIHCTDLKLSRNLSAHVRKSGIDEVTMMHGWIIGYLYDNREKDIYQKDLEKKFSISRSTVTNILKRMESKGYIRREPVPEDARLKKLVLTEEGLRLHGEKEALIAQMNEELRGTLDPAETEQFLQTVRKMKENIRKLLSQMGVRLGEEGCPEPPCSAGESKDMQRSDRKECDRR